MKGQEPQDFDSLAAEYVLGLLSGPDQARADQLARQSPEFAAQIAAWEMRLAPLADEIPAQPAPDLMPRINARLFGARPTVLARLRRLLGGNGFVASAVGTAVMAAAAVIGMALLLLLDEQIQGPRQNALLQAEGSAVQFQAQLQGDGLIVTQVAGAPPGAGRSYELWLIDGDAAPLALGLIEADLRITLPAANPGYVLAVTDEPFGGGPGGVPTGAVIALGKF